MAENALRHAGQLAGTLERHLEAFTALHARCLAAAAITPGASDPGEDETDTGEMPNWPSG